MRGANTIPSHRHLRCYRCTLCGLASPRPRAGNCARETHCVAPRQFTIVLCVSLVGMYKSRWADISIRDISPKALYFVFVALMAFLDLFRYWTLAIDDRYKCSGKTWVYGLHMLANSAFFASYSVICFLWQNSVAVDQNLYVFGRKQLASFNAFFLIFSLAGVGVCEQSDNLEDFFHSGFFAGYTVITATKNLTFFTVILWSGLKVQSKIKESRSIANQTDETMSERFSSILRRLNVILVACVVATITRCIMLVIKLLMLRGEIDGKMFGDFWWWALSDFTPRLLPTACFMTLMFGSLLTQRRKPSMKQYQMDVSEMGSNRLSSPKGSDAKKHNSDSVPDDVYSNMGDE